MSHKKHNIKYTYSVVGSLLKSLRAPPPSMFREDRTNFVKACKMI